MRPWHRTALRLPSRARAGVTLVEVVIAIFVLTVGVLSIIALFPSGYSLSQGAVDRTISALAARDALARILAESKQDTFTFPTQTFASAAAEPLYCYNTPSMAPLGLYLGVTEVNRAAIVATVATHGLTCKIRGGLADGVDPSTLNTSPDHWPNLAGYYVVVTSGAAAGGLYPILSSSGGTLTFPDSVTFRTETTTGGIPVRVGDYLALIGNKTVGATLCFPDQDHPVGHSNFLSGGANRTIAIATQGDPTLPWQYSYGCILSASTIEARNIFRVDVFVFRNIQDGTIQEQDRPVGHFVTYIHSLENYETPFP